MESLVIRLSEQDDAPAAWMVVDATGMRLSNVQVGPLALAAPLAAGKRVWVLVPGVEVLLTEAELPVRGASKLAQVVPYALEEHLADDVDEMHFALGKRGTDATGTPVAAVRRDRLEAWIARLAQAQIQPDAVLADTSAVPSNPGQTVLLIEGEHLLAHRAGMQPVVLHATPLTNAFEVVGALGAETADNHALLYLSPDDWQRHQLMIEGARDRFATLKVQLLPDGALPLLAMHAVTQPALSLLQGRYAPRTHGGEHWRRWRLAAILLAALVGLNLVSKAIDIWRLSRTEHALDAAIEQVFRQAMPGEQNAVDARRRMEARLAALHGAGGAGHENLLGMLSAVANAVSQVSDASLQALSFRSDVLDLKVGAKDVTSIERLRHTLTDSGLQAELQSSSASTAGVEGRMQVKGAGKS